MKKLTKTLSVMLSVLFVAALFIGFKPVQASAAAAPALNFVGYEHSPLQAGETEGFYLSASNYGNTQVQYKLWVNKVGTDKWDVLNDYGTSYDPKAVSLVTPSKTYDAGYYRVSVWVKDANGKGLNGNANGRYDAAYLLLLNVVSPDSKTRVTSTGDLQLSPSTFSVGSPITLNGINGMTGVSASSSYLYKFHAYDVTSGTWLIDNQPYRANPTFTPQENGQYILDVWALTKENPTGPREVIRLKSIQVGGSQQPTTGKSVLKTSVSSAMFGSNVTVSIEGNDYPAITQYQVYSVAGKPVSAASSVGQPTTVFPAVKTGDSAVIKLLDASGNVVLTETVTLGTDFVLPAPTQSTQPTTGTTGTIKTVVASAMFGSNVTASIDGYTAATNFQVFSAAGKAISAVSPVGQPTTVFPAVKTGDSVTVKLLDNSSKVLVSQTVTLGTDATFTVSGSSDNTTTTTPTQQSGQVTGTVAPAMFGSNVTVTATGYTGATNFQVYSLAGKAISASSAVGQETTVFPAVKSGDTVTVKILNASGAVIDTQNVTLK